MRATKEKADFLITLVGTSAMPNLIGIVTRIKENGKIFLINTEETKNISQNLYNFLDDKSKYIKKELLQIDNYDNPEAVYIDIYKIFKNILNEIINSGITEPLVEINYTGGTKVISSIACSVFKKIFKSDEFKLNLTYLDGEESKIKIFNLNDKKEVEIDYSVDLGTIPLSIKDVIKVHKKSNDIFDNLDFNGNYKISKFSKDMFAYIIGNLDDRKRIINYLDELHDNLGQNKYEKSKNKVKDFLNEFSSKYKLLKGYDCYKDYFDALNVKEEELTRTNLKSSINEILTGTWFEEIIYQILLELKNEKIIDDFVNNVSRGKTKSEFEIDFIAMKDYKLYFFSVSTADEVDLTKFKLYEIKQRARILSETEAAVAAITFVDNKDEIIEEYKNIWEEEPKNTCIITYNDLPGMKSIIKQWIMKKGC